MENYKYQCSGCKKFFGRKDLYINTINKIKVEYCKNCLHKEFNQLRKLIDEITDIIDSHNAIVLHYDTIEISQMSIDLLISIYLKNKSSNNWLSVDSYNIAKSRIVTYLKGLKIDKNLMESLLL